MCELSDRTRAVAETYLVWKAGTTQPDGEPWWHTHLDWSRLAKDLDDRRVGLSSTEKALARVPHAQIGEVTSDQRLRVSHAGGTVIDTMLDPLRMAWQTPLAAS